MAVVAAISDATTLDGGASGARIAVATVRDWVEARPRPGHVTSRRFSEHSAEAHRRALEGP